RRHEPPGRHAGLSRRAQAATCFLPSWGCGPYRMHSPERSFSMTVKAFGAQSADRPLEPLDITRRAPGAHDVQIAIAYCGVCHSDLHQVRAEWAGTLYPCVPGHEIVGRVTAVGPHVEGFAPGDL